jgi:hypothetical protein
MNELKDPDLRYFAQRLIHTKEGARYIKAWRELKHLRKTMPEHRGDALAALRRRYIVVDEKCSAALAALERMHSWPKP